MLATRELARQPHFSAPDPLQTVYKSKNALGSSSISSQSRLCDCECGSSFSTKADLKRHQDATCSLTEDKIQFTCLLNVSAPTCHRPCSKDSHQNECSATCQYRLKHDESCTTLYQNRVDKMRIHLQDCHGWGRFPQGRIPKSWKWPLKRVIPTDGDSGPIWACVLCDEPLGRWEEDQVLINKHCVYCLKGVDARAARFPRHSGQKLEALLAKGVMGSKVRDDDDDDDDESGEYNATSQEW